ncbi:MAG: hypothetical protein IT292_02630 [Deltaproteobacteria bacterium]|nr:hypothetical protein [Deltaproteobacteria bacterium]
MEKAYFGQSYAWVFPIEGNKEVRTKSEAQSKIAKEVTEIVDLYFSSSDNKQSSDTK